MPPTLLDTRELSEALDVNYADVLAWAKSGHIPSITVGKRRVFNLSAVVRALRPAPCAVRRPPPPEPTEARPCAM